MYGTGQPGGGGGQAACIPMRCRGEREVGLRRAGEGGTGTSLHTGKKNDGDTEGLGVKVFLGGTAGEGRGM